MRPLVSQHMTRSEAFLQPQHSWLLTLGVSRITSSHCHTLYCSIHCSCPPCCQQDVTCCGKVTMLRQRTRLMYVNRTRAGRSQVFLYELYICIYKSMYLIHIRNIPWLLSSVQHSHSLESDHKDPVGFSAAQGEGCITLHRARVFVQKVNTDTQLPT